MGSTVRTLFQIETINPKCGQKSGAAGKSPKCLNLIEIFFKLGSKNFV
jgi:hypothetical protein